MNGVPPTPATHHDALFHIMHPLRDITRPTLQAIRRFVHWRTRWSVFRKGVLARYLSRIDKSLSNCGGAWNLSTTPECLPTEVIEARQWLKHHDVGVYKCDKNLGWVIAQRSEVNLLLYHAFQSVPFQPACWAKAHQTWQELRDICNAVCREDSRLSQSVHLPPTAEVPPAVVCVKVHKMKMRQVISCGSTGVNRVTKLVLRIFRGAANSPATFRSLVQYAERIRSSSSATSCVVVGDAAGMYLNVPRDAILRALEMLCAPTGLQLELVRRLLGMTFFTVCGELMTQSEGVFMGMGCAPLLACAPYVAVERLSPTGPPRSSFQVYRYMDDVVVLLERADDTAYLTLYGDLPMTFEPPSTHCTFAGLTVSIIATTATTARNTLVVTAELRAMKRFSWTHRKDTMALTQTLGGAYGLLRHFARLSDGLWPFLCSVSGTRFMHLLAIHGFSQMDIRTVLQKAVTAIALAAMAADDGPLHCQTTGERSPDIRRVRLPYSPVAGGHLNRNLLFRYLLVDNLRPLQKFLPAIGSPHLVVA